MRIRIAPRWRWDIGFLGIALVAGILAALAPWVALVAAIGALGFNIALRGATRLPGIFLAMLGGILVGYTFFSRGFAHIGISPLYVGEMVLAVGLLAAILNPGMRLWPRSATGWLWVLFALWGAARTIPYLREYGVDALHDAALWAYGLFALLVTAALRKPGWTARVPGKYGKVLPWFVCWAVVAGPLLRIFPWLNAQLPGSTKPLVVFNAGNVGVHLGGAAVFLLLGLRSSPGSKRRRGSVNWARWALWIVWLIALFLVASWSRGGALAALAAVLLAILFRPDVAGRSAGLLAAFVVTLLLGSLAMNFSVDVGGYRGKLSPSAMAGSMTSIVGMGGGQEGARAANANWRLRWWRKIISYTLFGDRFWMGKGFGVNLADDDGFQVTRDHSLRSPHDVQMTVLARAGVPGEVLWLALQAAFGISLFRAYRRARRARREWWARVDLWVLCYWASFLVSAAFDVFLEGPQGGIWFWSLMGFGLAAIEVQRREIIPGRAALALREQS